MFKGITSGPFSGDVFGPRPVIGKDDLAVLGLPGAVDPEFRNGGAAVPVMIMPTRSKKYTGFLDHLWKQAAHELGAADRIAICGYGMLPVDRRACELLLESPKKHAEVVVSSGVGTNGIVARYQEAGYTRAVPAEQVMFEKWVDSCANAAVA
jgi:hypothetical protein